MLTIISNSVIIPEVLNRITIHVNHYFRLCVLSDPSIHEEHVTSLDGGFEMTGCWVKTVCVVDWFLVKGNGTFRNDSTRGVFGGLEIWEL